MEKNRIPRKILYMNLAMMRLRGRARNRWQDEVWEDGRLVGGKRWKERVYKREELKSSWERQGITAFCTWQWNEWMIQDLSFSERCYWECKTSEMSCCVVGWVDSDGWKALQFFKTLAATHPRTQHLITDDLHPQTINVAK
jgi:hypothetical protein